MDHFGIVNEKITTISRIRAGGLCARIWQTPCAFKNEKRYLVTGDNGDDGKEAFPVHLSKDGKQRYINVGEDGDWYIIQYKADKVQLSFSVANTAAVAAEISAGLIEGEVSKGLFGDQVRVTDTPKKVAKWLKKNGDELFKARMSMARMGAVPKGCK